MPIRLKSFSVVLTLTRNSYHHLIFSSNITAQREPGPPLRYWGFQTTQSDTPQSVGLLWTRDRFVAETST